MIVNADTVVDYLERSADLAVVESDAEHYAALAVAVREMADQLTALAAQPSDPFAVAMLGAVAWTFKRLADAILPGEVTA